MRKTLAALAALLLIVGLFAVPALADTTYYVAPSSGSTVNMRAEPGMNGAHLVKVPWGTELNVTQISADGQWGYTSYANGGKVYSGWMKLQYLSTTQPQGSNPMMKAVDNLNSMNYEFKAMQTNPLAEPYKVMISTDKPNERYHLRWAPYLSAFSMRDDVVNGEVFTVTAVGNRFLQVVDNQSGRTAYIASGITVPYDDEKEEEAAFDPDPGHGDGDPWTDLWADENSMRAHMAVTTADGENYDVCIFHPSSVSEETLWTMRAKKNPGGSLTYTDGKKVINQYATDGTVTDTESAFEASTGTFTLKDGKVTWTDDKETEAGNYSFTAE